MLSGIKDKQYIILGAAGFSILALPFIVFYWLLPFSGDLILGNDYGNYPIQNQLELQYSIEHESFPLYIPGFAQGRSSAALTLGQIFHPAAHLSRLMPGYWDGLALEWNTFFRLIQLGIAQLAVIFLLVRLNLSWPVSFFLSFITIYNLRMLDLFRYGASLESYAAYLFLCSAIGLYFLKRTKFIGPLSIMISIYLLICSGHPQMMYYGLLGAVIVTLSIPFAFRAINSDIVISRNNILHFYFTVGAFSLIGLLLSSAYIVPFYFDFIADAAVRVGRDYQWSVAYSDTWGGALGSLFAPLKSDVHGAFGSSPIIILAILSPLLFIARKRVPPVVIILWFIAILVFLCSVGKDTAVHHLFWEYFPQAQSFRVPGRVNMILPFILLLILGWIFNPAAQQKSSINNSTVSTHATFILVLLSITVYSVFNWFLADKVPKSSFYIPARILGDNYPDWIDQTILWLGFIALLVTAAHQFCVLHTSRRIYTGIGLLLVSIIIIQGTLQLRYGSWVVEKKPVWTLEEMNARKIKSIGFSGSPGYGMETATVSNQMERSFLEPYLAKFYRKNLIAKNQDDAYRLMATERLPDTIIVEGDHLEEQKESSRGIDQVELIYNSFNKLTFTVNAGSAGYVMLAYPYSDKWSSYVDEDPAIAYRANGNLIAVHVGAGKHTVTFQYFSYAALAGMIASCLTLLLTGIYFSLFVFKGPGRWGLLAVSLSLPLSVFSFWYLNLYNGENLNTNYRWDSSELPPNGNMSYGRPTRMSSIWTAQMPYITHAGKAVNGDREKQGFVTNARDQGSWWEVDLGMVRSIGYIVVYARTNSSANLPLKILVSKNGKIYYHMKTIENGNSKRPWEITIPEVQARFVRLALTKPGPMSLQEVEIYKAGDRLPLD